MLHTDRPNRIAENETPTTSPVPLLLRIVWMLVGNMALAVCALSIAMRDRNGIFSALDAVFWALAALVIGARYLDITRYAGTTSDGQPATLAHWRRFALIEGGAAGLVWLGVHLFAQYVA